MDRSTTRPDLGLSNVSGARTVHTFCRYCLAGCGVEVTVRDNRVQRIAPDKANPYTWHDFCAKGRTANEVVEHPRRILTPMKRVGDDYVEATWDEAIADIAARMTKLIAEEGPDTVGVYWGNPAGFSIPNVVFQNGWLDAIGTMSRYYVGSVDQNAMHVVATAMYGSQLFAPIGDIDNSDYFLLLGANPAVSAWGWADGTVPDGWRRCLERQRAGARIVVVDPVRTETARKADDHLRVRPGQDWALLLGLIKVVLDEGLEHRGDCDPTTGLATGVDDLRGLVREVDLDDLAARCEVARADIERIAREFANARTAMAITRTGVAHHETGTIGEWLGHVLNVITGRMDRPGGRRYQRGYVDSLRIWDVMAKPMTHRSRVQGRPMVAGHHGLDELPDEITTPGRGRVRALVINAGNPVVSGPDGAKLDAALAQLDLLVAVDLVQRESHRHAHWLLPGVHWLERDDLFSLTSGLQDGSFVQYGRKVVEPPPGAREEWRFYCDLTLAMGRPLFGYRGVNTAVRTSRWLARWTGRPGLAFSPRWIDRLLVASGRTVKWRDVMRSRHGLVYGERQFGRLREALKTPDRRIHAAPSEFLDRTRELLRTPAPAPPPQYPFLLGNRRHRHSMNSFLNDLPGLHRGCRHNAAVLNPEDAAELEIAEGDLVRVFSAVGEIELPATISDEPRRGLVLVDHGWGSRVFDPRGGAPAQSYGVNRNLLVDASRLDPLSQTPALSSAWVGVAKSARSSV
ncbi:molybdopterin-containing oxidoreductase family protein [Sporichthya brevicatena]|uniref:molybdopterin-containing oxidoreductase family protein n=1 Tax=Sporichthya brevicatena TaxID=171442 RepID=UPI0031D66115